MFQPGSGTQRHNARLQLEPQTAMATSIAYPSTLLLIDGQWCDAADGRSLPVLNPATGGEIGRVAHAGIADLDRALAAAQKGFAQHLATLNGRRVAPQREAARLMRERADTTAALMTMEQGKPLSEARVETLAAADILEWFSEESRRVYGRIVPPRNMAVSQQVLKEPVGPVAAFTPWNFPINQVVRKVSAALATGCSIIVKAPEETPASPAALMKCLADAGVPAGVIGLVYGNPAEISTYLIPHPVIRKITFTGSTPVGKQLAAMAGQHMKRVTMELGGHAPVIVAEDADVMQAVKAAGGAKYRNAGQVCISPTRFLVHNSIKAEFERALVAHSEALKLGDGLKEGTTLGPLANPRRLAAMHKVTEDALKQGAKLATGGQRVGSEGNFFQATVLTDVPITASVFNEEPFGPVAAVRGFNTLDEAIAESNRLPYGLASYAYTQSVATVHQLSQRIEAGMLWINQPALALPEMPFGGMKDSGYGSEGGPEALEAYVVTKTVSVNCG
jgi:succinate-semialdehyde dehydrogenase / glutarate-semialdehyde dehydrogenase